MCDVLGVSRSGFNGWERRAPSDRDLSDAWPIERIKEIHARARGVYGSRRVQAELRLGEGVEVSRKRVQRLMRAVGISGLVKVKKGRTTIRVPGVRVADDLVERQFRPEAPNVLWVADLTYLRTWEGWLYLAAVQDAYSKKIVGWAMAEHMRSELVLNALQMGLHRRRPDPGLIHHSDLGSQYVSLAFGIAVSMGSRAMPTTTPSPRASSRPSRRSSCTAKPGRHAESSAPRSSSTSRASTTATDDTPPSDISPLPNTRTERPRPRPRQPTRPDKPATVHKAGSTPGPPT